MSGDREKVKVIVAGSRTFDNYDLMCDKLDRWLSRFIEENYDIEIVSGGQRTYDQENNRYYGADYFGECYAHEHGYTVKKFPPDWHTHGRSAGPIRNLQMAQYSNFLCAFWNGKSKGTENMINTARMLSMPVRIYNELEEKP